MPTRNNFGNPILDQVPINFDGSGDNIVIAAPLGGAIELYQIYLLVGGATNLTWKDGVAGRTLSGPLPMLANGSITLDFSGAAWHTTSPGNSLVLSSSAAVQVSGTAYYMQK